MLVDVHAHYVPAECFRQPSFGFSVVTLPDFGPTLMRAGAPLGPAEQTIEQLSDLPRRLADMDGAGIDMQALSVDPGMFGYDLELGESAQRCAVLNAGLAATVQAAPDRFVALGTVSLQSVPAAVAQLQECLQRLGMRGVSVCTDVNGTNLGEPEFWPFWEAAEALNATVLLHPYNPAAGERTRKHGMRVVIGNPFESSIALYSIVYSGVLERYPRLRVIVVHGGGVIPYLLGRIRKGDAVRSDMHGLLPRPLSEYLSRVYVDTVVHDPATLAFLVQIWGADLIAPGTDYPYDLGDLRPRDTVAAAQLDDDVRHQILERNGARALGLLTDVEVTA
jgi:aminocarboxymuconate-semialdehyde decarboxylase